MHEGTQDRSGGIGIQREVDADMDAAVPEVPVGDAVQAVLDEERLEFAEVGTQPGRRDRGVLQPARPGRSKARAASPAPSSRIRQSARMPAG